MADSVPSWLAIIISYKHTADLKEKLLKLEGKDRIFS